MRTRLTIIILVTLIVLTGWSFKPFINSVEVALAQSADTTAKAAELQSQIDNHNNNIKALEDEIKKYQAELDKTSAQAKTLQSAVKTLDVSSQKIGADLNVTENKIEATDLTIQSLSTEITDKQSRINTTQKALAESLRSINQNDRVEMLETFLSNSDLSELWNSMAMLDKFQENLQDHIDSLRGLKSGLEINKSDNESQKDRLQELKDQLADQRKVVESTKAQKNELLKDTKSQESAYKTLIAEKQAKQKQFNDELIQFQSQLKLVIDPASLPTAKSGVLGWPTDKRTVTQYFGNTEFAKANSTVYNGNGHSGIDIGVSIGTVIKSAESGTVLGTGNTDTACPNASYGNWVLVQHGNGLSTLYAHLSVISVSKGQSVKLGQTVGYSGMTGYATGPHLHFAVFASQGVQISTFASKGCPGKMYTMPVADLKAYLNPINYL